MPRFVVIAGSAKSGKLPLARKLMADDPALALVHRDDIRAAIGAKVDEWHITLLMQAMARRLLDLGHSVVICAWNMEVSDAHLWTGLAVEYSVELEWLDTREPEVAAMIPPLAA